MSISVTDIFWIFIAFMALQPLIRQWLVSNGRTRKIMQFESIRQSRLILLVHRQETMRLFGFPLVRFIDINDSEAVLRAIQLTGDDVPSAIVTRPPTTRSST